MTRGWELTRSIREELTVATAVWALAWLAAALLFFVWIIAPAHVRLERHVIIERRVVLIDPDRSDRPQDLVDQMFWEPNPI